MYSENSTRGDAGKRRGRGSARGVARVAPVRSSIPENEGKLTSCTDIMIQAALTSGILSNDQIGLGAPLLSHTRFLNHSDHSLSSGSPRFPLSPLMISTPEPFPSPVIRSPDSYQDLKSLPSPVRMEEPLPRLQHELCAGCHRPITDRFLLKVMGCSWHEACLRCSCCGCRLGEVGATLFSRANLLLCKRDYIRMFGPSGLCSSCSKIIPADEMVMKAKHLVYHLECFTCQLCSHRFSAGERYGLYGNKILCQADYEEMTSSKQLATIDTNRIRDFQRDGHTLSDISITSSEASR